MFRDETPVRVTPAILAATIDQRLLLVDPDTGSTHVLDPGSALVWTSAIAPVRPSDIVAALLTDIGGDRDEIDRFVQRTLGTLEVRGLIDRIKCANETAAPGSADQVSIMDRAGTAPDSDLVKFANRVLGRRVAGSTPLVVTAGTTTVELAAETPELEEMLSSTFGDLPRSDRTEACQADHRLVVLDRGPGTHLRYRVVVDGRIRHRTDLLARTTRHTTVELNRLARTPAARLLTLHAGAVELDGRVAIIAGHSGKGKSLLTAALTHHGCHYLTDEVVVVDPSTGAVSPYPKPIELDATGWNLLGRIAPAGDADQKFALRAGSLGSLSYGGTAHLLVFLDGAGSGSTDTGYDGPVHDLPEQDPVDRTIAVLANTFVESFAHPTNASTTQLQRIVDWSAGLPTLHLDRIPVDDAARIVTDRLSKL